MFDYVKKKEFEEFKECVKEILGYMCDDKKLFETALINISKRINTLEEKLKQLEQENKKLREENDELREFVEASLREMKEDLRQIKLLASKLLKECDEHGQREI